MEYPKKKRIVDKELVKQIMAEQKHCLITDYDSHRGEDCPHHIISRGAGGDDVRGNIIRVCLHHHQMIHNGLIPKGYLYNKIKYVV